ncbi:hypothetical protein BDZ88DRAFT_53881 [Geranomyces variabilis]|nr:hypothetical protein BDZ88DRAFT_53881 [Geranomyces variabilis]
MTCVVCVIWGPPACDSLRVGGLRSCTEILLPFFELDFIILGFLVHLLTPCFIPSFLFCSVYRPSTTKPTPTSLCKLANIRAFSSSFSFVFSPFKHRPSGYDKRRRTTTGGKDEHHRQRQSDGGRTTHKRGQHKQHRQRQSDGGRTTHKRGQHKQHRQRQSDGGRTIHKRGQHNRHIGRTPKLCARGYTRASTHRTTGC